MRRLAIFVLGGAAALGLCLGILWAALPGATLGSSAKPDPLIAVRRPVVAWLRRAGILRGPSFLGGDPYLPSGSWTCSGGWRTSVHRDPVHRGLLWRVGTRLTVEHDAPRTARSVRVSCRCGGRERAIGVGHLVEGAASGDRARWRVTASLPEGWTWWGIEEEGEDGRVREVRSEEVPAAGATTGSP